MGNGNSLSGVRKTAGDEYIECSEKKCVAEASWVVGFKKLRANATFGISRNYGALRSGVFRHSAGSFCAQ